LNSGCAISFGTDTTVSVNEPMIDPIVFVNPAKFGAIVTDQAKSKYTAAINMTKNEGELYIPAP